MPNTLATRRDGPILWVTLDRPQVMNAYNAEMGAELVDAFQAADADDSIRVIVLTGAGRVFCAGADVSKGAGAFEAEAGNFGLEGRNSDFISAMWNCRKPAIVAFNGAAAGVGLTLALPCDIRIAVPTARFGCVFTRRGLVPEAGSAWFLPQLVGLGTALRWCLTGAMVPAEEALAAGLVSELVEPDLLVERARELALAIADNTAPVATALARRLLWRFAGDQSPWGALAVDAPLNIALGSSPDVREGVAAFLEKRLPAFPGRVSSDLPDTSRWWMSRPPQG
ncbi:MAG: enoyl-CoA hydratase-related protein [Sphingomonadaceae bacterium]